MELGDSKVLLGTAGKWAGAANVDWEPGFAECLGQSLPPGHQLINFPMSKGLVGAGRPPTPAVESPTILCLSYHLEKRLQIH